MILLIDSVRFASTSNIAQKSNLMDECLILHKTINNKKEAQHKIKINGQSIFMANFEFQIIVYTHNIVRFLFFCIYRVGANTNRQIQTRKKKTTPNPYSVEICFIVGGSHFLFTNK